MAKPKTRYPLPPERDPFEPFPDTIPWNTPISELQWWLEIGCSCGETVKYPLRLMAAEQGWKLTLSAIVPRLRCSRCNSRPETVRLDEDGTGQAIRSRTTKPLSLVLWEDGHLAP